MSVRIIIGNGISAELRSVVIDTFGAGGAQSQSELMFQRQLASAGLNLNKHAGEDL